MPLASGAIGLVPGDVGPDAVWRQKDDGVSHPSEPPAPVVSRAARLEQDRGGTAFREEGYEAFARHAVAFPDPSGLIRHGDLEDVLGQVNGDGRRL